MPPSSIAFFIGSLFAIAAMTGVMPRTTGASAKIILQLISPTGESTILRTVTGKAVSVTKAGAPETNLQPTLDEAGQLTLKVARKGAEPNANWTEVLSLSPGDTGTMEIAGTVFVVQWAGAMDLEEAASLSQESSGAGQCCVTCGDFRFCGCYVEAPCGNCCEKSCGGCGSR